jgi:hypothetical protein
MTLVTARAGEAHLACSVFALALAVRPLAAASPDCPVITNPFNALSEAQREARSVRTARSLEAATCNEINDPMRANDSNSAKQEGRTQSATVFQFDAWLASGTMPNASVNKLLISFDAPLTYQQAKHRDERI